MAKKPSVSKKDFKPNYGATIKTFPGKLIFPNVAKPGDFQGDNRMKFSASLILKPSERMTELLTEIDKVGSKSFSDWATGDYNKPVLTGEECMEKSDACRPELYKGNFRLTAKVGLESFKGKPLDPPACYLADGSKLPRRPGNEDDLRMIEETYYPGCYCTVAVSPMSYSKGNVQGVGLVFKAIRFIKDGTRLTGADVEGLMTDDEEIGSDYDFDDDTGLGSEEVSEANV